MISWTMAAPAQEMISKVQCANECNKVIKAADEQIKVLEDVIGKQSFMISQQKEHVNDLDARIMELEKSNKAWYREPTITIPGGILLGIIIMSAPSWSK